MTNCRMYLFTSACPKVASAFPWQRCLYEHSESQLLNGTKCCYIAATSTALACAVPRVYSVFQIQHIAGLQTCRFIKRPIRRLFSLKQGPSKHWFIYLTVSWFYQWLEEAGAHFFAFVSTFSTKELEHFLRLYTSHFGLPFCVSSIHVQILRACSPHPCQ